MSEAEGKPAEKKGAARRKPTFDPRLAEYRGVWVFVERDLSGVHPVSWELLGAARRLADQLGSEVGAVVAGVPEEALDVDSREAIAYGADVVYQVGHPVLAGYRNEPYSKLLCELVKRHKPEILLLGATSLGRDLASSVATTLETGLTADCTELAIDRESRALAATRPTFGGNLLCTILTLNYRPQMATVRPRVLPSPAKVRDRSGQIRKEEIELHEEEIVTKIAQFLPHVGDQVDLALSEVIVAGGKGLQKAANFALLEDLALALGGEVGATRAAVQAGWIDPQRQIGQTGKTVRPKLYIAAGISGAIQHRVGMESSDLIVAINTDPNAPIFEVAHYGIVGDAVALLPLLTRAVRGRILPEKATPSGLCASP
ncbi:Caffeyl-CoA reductase-Etf complex subunit CarE [Methylacidimicrobium cyclopophantes]|uniref:Caffeyl-CoA reductase-Etf complex subunit CarE n=1 Tax=Methylacidimicrobium cyclopophantes TaxID=1041766 RepID=A0A5E6M5J7_9BACT|nr:electron transfer flavoprotein subunit alpha/FixB family protein [Methylacidimicrobium cyclopophantes]VVM04609.1 Caffeyl-CoA reductase-Etf complex subunit CarE [Methylacidimicrobium cyclopophantes]